MGRKPKLTPHQKREAIRPATEARTRLPTLAKTDRPVPATTEAEENQTTKPMNKLFYGDNLDILRSSRKIKDETIDLCYIDPPFNSKRNYNQIYNNIGTEDRAQAQAFTDTWTWDDHARAGYDEILANDNGRFQAQLVELIKGLRAVLGQGSLLAYLISMSLRVTELQRILKPTGNFFLHCDPTASHYLKLVMDAVFCAQGGEFQNEIIWSYKTGGASKTRFAKKHDVILFYSKTTKWKFNAQKERSYTSTDSRKATFKLMRRMAFNIQWFMRAMFWKYHQSVLIVPSASDTQLKSQRRY
jgi:adenine specific DNA methylase Mod